MHSAGLELTKLTYTRLEDNLIRHRGDRALLSMAETVHEPKSPEAKTNFARTPEPHSSCPVFFSIGHTFYTPRRA